MFKEVVIVHMAGGLIVGLGTLQRECMEDDAHFQARAEAQAKRDIREKSVIFAVDTEIGNSRPIWCMTVTAQEVKT